MSRRRKKLLLLSQIFWYSHEHYLLIASLIQATACSLSILMADEHDTHITIVSLVRGISLLIDSYVRKLQQQIQISRLMSTSCPVLTPYPTVKEKNDQSCICADLSPRIIMKKPSPLDLQISDPCAPFEDAKRSHTIEPPYSYNIK